MLLMKKRILVKQHKDIEIHCLDLIRKRIEKSMVLKHRVDSDQETKKSYK